MTWLSPHVEVPSGMDLGNSRLDPSADTPLVSLASIILHKTRISARLHDICWKNASVSKENPIFATKLRHGNVEATNNIIENKYEITVGR